jgi:hypothetical protein
MRPIPLRSAWLFLYVLGLAAMASAIPVVFTVRGNSLTPLLLFPSGGIVAVVGALLAGRKLH